MKLQVRLFATLRQQLNAEHLTIDWPADRASITVGELRGRLHALHPALQPLLERTAIAVNLSYAKDDVAIQPDDEVALIPPVSGG